jgi:hypothetical protein
MTEHKPVSLQEIEQAFLSDREMYIQADIGEGVRLQIYHSEDDDADADECHLLLIAGNEQEEGITLTSDWDSTLEETLHHFRLDRTKSMWIVDNDVPRYLTEEEMRDIGWTEEHIQHVLANRKREK